MGEFLEIEGVRFEIRRRPRRRNITLSLRPNGAAHISASRSTPLEVLEGFLKEKRTWILRVLKRFEVLRAKYPRLVINEGAELPLLGEKYRLHLAQADSTSRKRTLSIRVMERNFIVSFPPSGMPQSEIFETSDFQEKLRHALRSHYKKVAAELISRRVEHWTRVTGLRPSRLSFRGQKTRWGSCSPSGAISLNWKLICADPSVIDYVIIHELCHLQHLNHSDKFWRLVEKFCPNWREKKDWLQSRSFEFDFLSDSSDLHG